MAICRAVPISSGTNETHRPTLPIQSAHGIVPKLERRAFMAPPQSESTTTLRVDKWLWATRFFKTRSLATAACTGEKIKRDGKAIKPSTPVAVGQRLQISKEGLIREIEIARIISKRVGHNIASNCYIDHTPQERIDALKEQKAAAAAHRPSGVGRPTKRDRRDIDALKKSLGDMGYGK